MTYPLNITPLLIGTIGMMILALALIIFIIFHQRKVIRYQLRMQHMENEQQNILLKASLVMQEEERQRIAADLHDDAGPLLATARLYLNENMIHQDKSAQLQSISNTKQIIDETIQLIRNISHSLMPPTLKNFGLESAVTDFFQKINASGSLVINCRFNDYKVRLKTDRELTVFRIIQELTNNILKHSNPTFIHLTQTATEDGLAIRLHHDGKGLLQEDFVALAKSSVGLGLKNIQSRLKVLDGSIDFAKDASNSFFKITMTVPKDEPELQVM